jgi:hypothetical protein
MKRDAIICWSLSGTGSGRLWQLGAGLPNGTIRVSRLTRAGVAQVTHPFTVQYVGNLEACRTEARILRPSAQSSDAPVAVVYETAEGFVVKYPGAGAPERALPGLEAAVAEARAELLHYINRKGETRPPGITRPGLSVWLMERDDETVMGLPLGDAGD